MKTLVQLTKRNIQVYFKDKGMFFTSLITPLILIALFVTFLGNVYRESFQSIIPTGIVVPDDLVEGFAGGFLFSSLLAVCCVTVAFCSNLLMVQDKVTGARTDLTMAPLKRSTLAMSYFISTAITTLIICGTALAVCFLYLWQMGWYLSGRDVVLTCLDVFLLVMFGTALSSVVNFPLSTQGHASAVGTIVSSMYGFICGAYMPISQFSTGIRTAISFLPGTYGTVLLHNHLMSGVLNELETNYVPTELVNGLRDAFDLNYTFFDHAVSIGQMYGILSITIILLIVIYVVLNGWKKR